MTVYEKTISKLRKLPEPFVEEVSDFIDFLTMKQDSVQWQLWQVFRESLELAEAGMEDYLSNLEDYEERLARGEIKW